MDLNKTSDVNMSLVNIVFPSETLYCGLVVYKTTEPGGMQI